MFNNVASNTTPPQTLRDLLGNAPLKSTARLTMSIADAIQHEPNQGARLGAVLAAAAIAAEQSGLPLYDCLTMTRNLMNSAEGIRAEFAAVESFMTEEVFNRA